MCACVSVCVCVGGGGGGVRMSRTGTKYVGTIRHMHGSWEETRAENQTEGLSEIWPSFNGRVNFCERRRREPLGALGASPPQKIFKPESLKTPFPALRGR